MLLEALPLAKAKLLSWQYIISKLIKVCNVSYLIVHYL